MYCGDPDEYTVNILEIYTKNIKYTLHCSRECSIFTVYFYMHSGIFTYVLRWSWWIHCEYTRNIHKEYKIYSTLFIPIVTFKEYGYKYTINIAEYSTP